MDKYLAAIYESTLNDKSCYARYFNQDSACLHWTLGFFIFTVVPTLTKNSIIYPVSFHARKPVSLLQIAVTILIVFKRESKCPRPAMSKTVTAKEASAVDKLFPLLFHDHPTPQSIAPFDLIFS